ncbi:MAG: diaminopimelate epimerase [Bacteroidota bacterium]|nr:diaminopimelate epimerase [Bacteroidota bacterium]
MKCNVTYMSGAGNLFTVVTPRDIAPEQIGSIAPHLCDAHATLGRMTEGILVVGDRHDDQLDVWYFNPDGSSGMMCGNGARCAVLYAVEKGIVNRGGRIRLSIAGTSYPAAFDGSTIAIEFPPPREDVRNLTLSINGHTLECAYVDVGSDHVVLPQSVVQRVYQTHLPPNALTELARYIRYHPVFSRGTNVNFYSVEGSCVYLATYERGVEAITGACGTGALATAVVLWRTRILPADSMTIIPPSREPLTVHIRHAGNVISSLVLAGPAQILAEQTVELPDIRR